MTTATSKTGRLARVLATLLRFAGAVSAQEQPGTFRVPFHIIHGLIFPEGRVTRKPAPVLLDSGADFTLISPEASGLSAKLDALKATKTTGANGEYVKARVDLQAPSDNSNPRLECVTCQ